MYMYGKVNSIQGILQLVQYIGGGGCYDKIRRYFEIHNKFKFFLKHE